MTTADGRDVMGGRRGPNPLGSDAREELLGILEARAGGRERFYKWVRDDGPAPLPDPQPPTWAGLALSQLHTSLSSEVPPSLLPGDYAVAKRATVVPPDTSSLEVNGYDGSEFAINVFPARSATGLRDGSSQAKLLLSTMQSMMRDQRELLQGATPSQSLEALLAEEQILEVCLHEVARQVVVHSAEQGAALYVLWARISELFGLVPSVVSALRKGADNNARALEQTRIEFEQEASAYAAHMKAREERLMAHIALLEGHLESQEIELNKLQEETARHEEMGASSLLTEKFANMDALCMELNIKSVTIERLQNETAKMARTISSLEVQNAKAKADVQSLTSQLKEARAMILRLELESAGEAATANPSTYTTHTTLPVGQSGGEDTVAASGARSSRQKWEMERLKLLTEIQDLSRQAESKGYLRSGSSSSHKDVGPNAAVPALPVSRLDPREQRWRYERNLLLNELFKLKSESSTNVMYKGLHHALTRRCARLHLEPGFQVRRAVKSGPWLNKIIGLVYHAKISALEHKTAPLFSQPFPEFVYEFLLLTYSRKSLVNQFAYDIVQAVEKYRQDDLWVDIFGRFLDEDLGPPALRFFMTLLTVADNSTAGIPYPVNPDTRRPFWICTRRCADVLRSVFPALDTNVFEGFMTMVNAKASTTPAATVDLLMDRPWNGDERIRFDTFVELALRQFQEFVNAAKKSAARKFHALDVDSTGALSLLDYLSLCDSLDFHILDPPDLVHLFKVALDRQFETGVTVAHPELDAAISWASFEYILTHSEFYTHQYGRPFRAPPFDLTDPEIDDLYAAIKGDWTHLQMVVIDQLDSLKNSPLPFAVAAHARLVDTRNLVIQELRHTANPLASLSAYRDLLAQVSASQVATQHARGEIPVSYLSAELSTLRDVITARAEAGKRRLQMFSRSRAKTKRAHVQLVTMAVLRIQRKFRIILQRIRERAAKQRKHKESPNHNNNITIEPSSSSPDGSEPSPGNPDKGSSGLDLIPSSTSKPDRPSPAMLRRTSSSSLIRRLSSNDTRLSSGGGKGGGRSKGGGKGSGKGTSPRSRRRAPSIRRPSQA